MAGKSMLIILDGWGINPDPKVSAIEAADTPFFDSLLATYPHATLITHGEDVGLPDGQMGNSEVGHLNLGAGRIIYQELARINKAIRDGELARNQVLLEAIRHSTGKIHLVGLVSDGGVHSHILHAKAIAKTCRQHYPGRVCLHAFTDGRDVDPKSGLGFLRDLRDELNPLDIPVASVVGRYYAMDRDKRWERIKLAYDMLVHGIGQPVSDIPDAIRRSYEEGITDEFIKPAVLVDDNQKPVGTIEDGDTVIFFNFRTDRPRQLTEVLSQRSHPDFDMHPLSIRMITMTTYDSTFTGIQTLFPESDIQGTIGEYLASIGKTQLRVAETEKYPHVTYFFSGGREAVFPGEERILIPSPKVPTYDLQPEMSAPEVAEAAINFIQLRSPDFICLNFANTDMVGHTGVFTAAVKAAETVDQCLSRLVPLGLREGYSMIILADHGNADIMINEDGSPNTAHTKNPVPVLFVSAEAHRYRVLPGRLADIAPTLLHAMHLPVPPAMTGNILLQSRDAAQD